MSPTQDRTEDRLFRFVLPGPQYAADLSRYDQLGLVVTPYRDETEWAPARFGGCTAGICSSRRTMILRPPAAADLEVDDVDAMERRCSAQTPAEPATHGSGS